MPSLKDILETIDTGVGAFNRGLTLGASDRILAGADWLKGKIAGEEHQNGLGDFEDSYSDYLKRRRETDAEKAERNPTADMIGGGLGMLAPAVLSEGATLAANPAAAGLAARVFRNPILKGAGELAAKVTPVSTDAAGAQILKSAGAGGVAGALHADDGKMTEDALKGLALGGGIASAPVALGMGLKHMPGGARVISALTAKPMELAENLVKRGNAIFRARELPAIVDESMLPALREIGGDATQQSMAARKLAGEMTVPFEKAKAAVGDPLGTPLLGREAEHGEAAKLAAGKENALRRVATDTAEVSGRDIFDLAKGLQADAREAGAYGMARPDEVGKYANQAAGGLMGIVKENPEVARLMSESQKNMRLLGDIGPITDSAGMRTGNWTAGERAQARGILSRAALGKAPEAAQALADVERVAPSAAATRIPSASGGFDRPALQQEAKDALTSLAFNTQNPNGSRLVNAYANAGEALGEISKLPFGEKMGKAIGGAFGLLADKTTAPAVKSVLQLANDLDEQGMQFFLNNTSTGKAIMDKAAKTGNLMAAIYSGMSDRAAMEKDLKQARNRDRQAAYNVPLPGEKRTDITDDMLKDIP